jgi:hypothetical protein
MIGLIFLSFYVEGQSDKTEQNIYKFGKSPVGKLTKIERNGRFGYKDERDSIIVDVIYNQLPDHPWELMRVYSGKECGVINYLGDTLIEFGKYKLLIIEHSLPFVNNLDIHGVLFFSDSAVWSWVCQKDDFFGMIDQYDNELIPIEFEKYKYLFNNKYAFYKNRNWTVYNANGNKLTAMEFDDVNQIFKEKYFIYKKDNLYGAYNVQKNKDVFGLYDMVIQLEADIICAKEKNQYILFNLDAKQLCNLKFDTLYVNLEINSPVEKSKLLNYADHKIIAWAMLNDRVYFINREGQVIEIE